MASVDLGKIVMPTEVVNLISKKVQEKSFVAALVPSEPETFGSKDYAVWTKDPEGEFVGEGKAKSSDDFKVEPEQGKLHKFQVTVRVDDEVKWADEDNQLDILNKLYNKMGEAKARGLDYGLGHAINPLTRSYIDTMKPEAIAWQAKQVEATTNPVTDLDNLPDAIIGDYDVTGIALDRLYASELRKVRIPNTGMRQFPEIGLDLNPGSVDGIKSVTTGSVAGRRLAPSPTGIKAILGNWNLVHWGFARDFGLEMIDTGDPDGLGDLKRYNQIAFRAECVFGWFVEDYNGLAVLRDKSTIPPKPDDGGDDDGGDDDGGDVETQSTRTTTKASSK